MKRPVRATLRILSREPRYKCRITFAARSVLYRLVLLRGGRTRSPGCSSSRSMSGSRFNPRFIIRCN